MLGALQVGMYGGKNSEFLELGKGVNEICLDLANFMLPGKVRVLVELWIWSPTPRRRKSW